MAFVIIFIALQRGLTVLWENRELAGNTGSRPGSDAEVRHRFYLNTLNFFRLLSIVSVYLTTGKITMPKSLSPTKYPVGFIVAYYPVIAANRRHEIYASTRIITSWIYYGVMTATTLTAIALLAVVWLLLRNKLLETAR